MTRGNFSVCLNKLDTAIRFRQALAYSVAPGGPNGRTRVLTTVVNLLSQAEIQQCFKRLNGEFPTAYEISLARSQVGKIARAPVHPVGFTLCSSSDVHSRRG